MKRIWLFALAISFTAFIVLPTPSHCQDTSANETVDGETIYRVGHGVTTPRATYQPMPSYDEASSKAKLEGVVVLSTIITKEGRTKDVKIVKSLSAGLDQQAIKAVSQWRFDPSTKDGKPVSVRVTVETSFRIAK